MPSETDSYTVSVALRLRNTHSKGGRTDGTVNVSGGPGGAGKLTVRVRACVCCSVCVVRPRVCGRALLAWGPARSGLTLPYAFLA